MAAAELPEPICTLCGAGIAPGADYIRTGRFLTHRDPLWRHAGRRLHRRCFLDWNARAEFVRKFNIVLDGLATMADDGTVADPYASDLTLPPP